MNTEIFKAYDIRGKVGTELTDEVAWQVGMALSDWLPAEGAVAVGYDMRPESKSLADALIEGVCLQGRNVINIGQVTTDMMYFAVGHQKLAGGAMITASHNGAGYNGIKVVREGVKPIGLDSGLDVIRDAAIAGNFVPAAEKGTIEEQDLREAWIEHALSFVNAKNWPDYHIAIDGGNGMIGLIAPLLEAKIPRLHVQRLYYELDGTFPNHDANPQKLETLTDLIAAINDNHYDFGLAFDGDGDRAALVDDKGRPVLGTDMISLVAKNYLAAHPGGEVVHDVRTSRATQELIREWGGIPVRTKAGRVNIGAVLYQRQAGFGGETTGHLFFADNYNADSGLIAALVAIQALTDSKRKLSELVDEYRRYSMISEQNFEVTDVKSALERLGQAFTDGKQDKLDGLTVDYATCWFNVRGSNTEPLLRLNAEASTEAELVALVKRVTEVITQ